MRSVNRLAQLYFKENNYEESLKYYKDLELISKNNREKLILMLDLLQIIIS